MIEKSKTKQRDLALDYIRILAMLMIVLCHFFQIIGSFEAAFWLNIGVQIFLILSAKLFCGKRFENGKQTLRFYRTRLFRIMLPIWIYLAAIVLVLCIIKQPPEAISVIVYALGGAAFIKTGVLGLGHFWYVSIILIAYLLVPLLFKFSERMKQAKTVAFALILSAVSIVLIGLFFLIGNPSYGVHLSLFIVCYYCFQRQDGVEAWQRKGIVRTLIPTVLLVSIRIVLDQIGIAEWKYYAIYDSIFVPVCKAVLGYFLFCVLHLLFSKECFAKYEKPILFLASISFEVYITHQFIELAIYKYVPYCNNGTLWGALIMLAVSAVLIALNTWVLHYAVGLLQKGAKRLKK